MKNYDKLQTRSRSEMCVSLFFNAWELTLAIGQICTSS